MNGGQATSQSSPDVFRGPARSAGGGAAAVSAPAERVHRKSPRSRKEMAGVAQDISPRFSAQQQMVLSLSAGEGLAHKEIAFRMSLSIGTVRAYLFRVRRKVGVQGQLQLTIWYWKQRLAEQIRRQETT